MFPRTYEDHRKVTNIRSAKIGETALIIGTIGPIRAIPIHRGRRMMLDGFFSDETGRISLKWFNGRLDYLRASFPPGSKILIKGTISQYGAQKVMVHPEMRKMEEEEEFSPKIVAVYTEHEGIPQVRLRNLVAQSSKTLNEIQDPLPEFLRTKLDLPNLSSALSTIHAPSPDSDFNELLLWNTPSQQRIIFDELFFFELYLLATRAKRQEEPGIEFRMKGLISEQLRKSLPFSLTQGQEEAIAEIIQDMQSPKPMHRLLQGDVGSGKTLVAFFAALLAIENEFQVAMMVPTEILAEQHFQSAQKFLKPLGINIGLLLSRQSARDKSLSLQEIKSGALQLVFGTHALFQEGVEFKNLGLAIIDEQHRFGVRQRLSLRKKGGSPDLLVLTATPIPRTLALSFYGDLDISTIRELPPGRLPITTKIATEPQRSDLYEFITKQIDEGAQAYVVLPLIQESEKIDLKNAIEMAEQLKHTFPKLNIGLLHGNLPSDEKQEVMNRFKQGTIHILVSTTVIEVAMEKFDI